MNIDISKLISIAGKIAPMLASNYGVKIPPGAIEGFGAELGDVFKNDDKDNKLEFHQALITSRLLDSLKDSEFREAVMLVMSDPRFSTLSNALVTAIYTVGSERQAAINGRKQ